MVRKHLVQTSIVATLSLLAVVFSVWMKPLNSFDAQKINKTEKVCCLAQTSSTVYLSEVKPRISGGGVSNANAFLVAPAVCLQHGKTPPPDSHKLAFASNARIWLMHRSLLI
jgi:hypothetical protein